MDFVIRQADALYGDALARYVKPYSILRVEGNLAVARLHPLLATVPIRLGVGTFNHEAFTLTDPTYPRKTREGTVLRATFGVNDANFPWQCLRVGNCAADSVVSLLDNKAMPLGIKRGGIWVLTVTVPFA